MERQKSWYVLTICSCMAAAVMFAACGKKTVNPPESGETADSGQETERETGQSGAETEGEPEVGDGEDRLAGGSVGRANFEIGYVEKEYEAEDGAVIFELKIAYPILIEENTGTKVINAFFEAWKDKKLEEYESDENSTRQSALEVYRESKDAGWQGPWGERYDVASVRTWGGYLSVLLEAYLYEGGAHGMPYREGHVFRMTDGQEVRLSELTDKTQEDWEKLLRAGFADKIAKGEENEFYDDAIELIKERDMSDVGYYFTETGIAFYLPPYEISPYSTGYVEITVPFEEAGMGDYQTDYLIKN